MKRKIEVYYSSKSKVLYINTPDGNSYFVTNAGHVGPTCCVRNLTVGSVKNSCGTYENAKMVCELTPSVIRKLKKVLA